MKLIILKIFLLLLLVSPASAEWYIINLDTNRAVAKTNYQPDEADLQSRNEVAIFSEADIPLKEAELFQGKIQQRVKSQAEVNEDVLAEKQAAELQKIKEKMQSMAYDALVLEGSTFEAITKESFTKEVK